MDAAHVYAKLNTRPEGLTGVEAQARLEQYGPNVLAKDQRAGIGKLLWRAVLNPLVLLLAALATISFATGDARSGVVMLSMIVLSVGLKLIQEARAESAAAKLKAMISVTATVSRDGTAQEIAVAQLVPGDVVQLTAGDMVPGDVRIVKAKDLFVNQGSLTGESFPVEKSEIRTNAAEAATAPIALRNVAFLGTSVESGAASAVVVATGKNTYLGSMAESLQEPQAQTSFDRGIAQFTWLMLRFMLVMVPLVFVINGLTKGNWIQAFFFALAVAVGLTPEMLPMIVTVCLSKGAVAMGHKKVIVKRINAIQNLGAMDVLCTDKTGTLTTDRVVLERYCNVMLREDDGVLALAYLNSHFQTGLKNVLDRAVLAHTETHVDANICRIHQGRRDPVRLRATHHVGRGPHARRQGPDHLQGRSRVDVSQMQERRARRHAAANGSPAHRGSQERIRATQCGRLPRARHRNQGRRAAWRRSGRRDVRTARPTSTI